MNLENRIEAILLLSKDRISITDLAIFFKLDDQKVIEILDNLKQMRIESGINLKVENGYVSLVTNPLYGEDIKNFFTPDLKIKKMTRSSMETLSIIAYKGPITKTEVENIRGVSAEKAITNLLEKKLIHITGKRKGIGTPNEYEVTEEFYSYLNVKNKEELPGFEEFSNYVLESKIKDDTQESIIE